MNDMDNEVSQENWIDNMQNTFPTLFDALTNYNSASFCDLISYTTQYSVGMI